MKLMVFWDVIMGYLVIHADVLEEPTASIFRVCYLHILLDVTSQTIVTLLWYELN